MKKHLWTMLGLAALAAPAAIAADTLTSEERSFAMSHLNATRKHFYDSIQGLSEAQWNFKAAPDRWSVLECAEHIALSEDFLFGLLTEKVLKGEITPGKNLKETTSRSSRTPPIAPRRRRPPSRCALPRASRRRPRLGGISPRAATAPWPLSRRPMRTCAATL